MSSKRKITVDLSTSNRKSRDRGERSAASDSKSSRDNRRSTDKERSDRNDELNRSGDRDRSLNSKSSSSRDRDRGGADTQQQRASVFSRLGKGPLGGAASTTSSSKGAVTQQAKVCHPWAETGQCPFGNECRYKHGASLVSPSKKSSSAHSSNRDKEKDRDGGPSSRDLNQRFVKC